MASNLSYNINDSNIVLYIDGVQYVVYEDDAIFEELEDLLMSECEDKCTQVKNLIDKVFNAVINIGENVSIKNDSVYIDSICVDNSIGKLINNLYKNNRNLKPLINFIKNVRKNPNEDIVNEIYDFIEKSYIDGGFTITEDGNIVAYKNVRDDYKDIHSELFYNFVGTTVEMDRSEVCSDRNVTCAPGLHFCSYSYLNNYRSSTNGRTMILEINPKHVVSIPVDYDNAKGRCCKYKVIGELGHDQYSIIESPLFKNDVNDDELTNIYNDVKILERKLDSKDNCEIRDPNIIKKLSCNIERFCSLYTKKEIERLFNSVVNESVKFKNSKTSKHRDLLINLKRASKNSTHVSVYIFMLILEKAIKERSNGF